MSNVNNPKYPTFPKNPRFLCGAPSTFWNNVLISPFLVFQKHPFHWSIWVIIIMLNISSFLPWAQNEIYKFVQQWHKKLELVILSLLQNIFNFNNNLVFGNHFLKLERSWHQPWFLTIGNYIAQILKKSKIN